MTTTTANGTAKPKPTDEKTKTESIQRQRRLDHHEADILIIGAGVLGSALAVTFGRQGRSVLLLETSLKEPDRIVGELLQPGGVRALEVLGLRDCLEGIDAIRVQGFHVEYHGDFVDIPYPEEQQQQSGTGTGTEPAAKTTTTTTTTRPEGRSFHHGRFITKLREAALACPNVTVVETKATNLVTCTYNNQVLGATCTNPTTGKRDCYFASLTVAADGYASKFRKGHHDLAPRVRSRFFGLELIDAVLPRPGFGHILLSDDPPILLYQIGTRETRILVDVPEGLPSAAVARGGVRGHLRNVVLPSLPGSVQPAFLAALEAGRLRSMPNSFLPAAANRTPGLVMLGDALNMRHPLTGGGMTVALNDVVLIRGMLSPENVPNLADTKAVLRTLESFHWKRKHGSSVINILAMALYSLFAADSTFIPSHCHYTTVFMPLLLTPNRPQPKTPPTRLLPLLPTRPDQRPHQPPRRPRPRTPRPDLPLLRRRLPLHLGPLHRNPCQSVPRCPVPRPRGVLHGLCGYWAVSLFGVVEVR